MLSQWKNIVRFVDGGRRYYYYLALIATICFFASLTVFVQAWTQETLINIVVDQNLSLLLSTILMVSIIYVLLSCLSALNNYVGERFNRSIEFKLRRDIYTKLKKLPYRRVKSKSNEELVMHMSDDISAVAQHLSWSIVELITILLIGIIALIITALTSYIITIIIVCAGTAHVCLLFHIIKKQKQYEQRARQHTLSVEAESTNTIQSFEIWNNQVAQQWKYKKFMKARQKQLEVNQKLSFFYFYSQHGNNLVSKVLPLLLSFYVFYLILNNEGSLGLIFALQILAMNAISPFTAISSFMINVKNLNIAYEKLSDLMADTNEAYCIFATEVTLPNTDDAIVYQVNQLVYLVDKKRLLSPISFELEAGKKLHIQGNSGVGKSTLVP